MRYPSTDNQKDLQKFQNFHPKHADDTKLIFHHMKGTDLDSKQFVSIIFL